MFLVIGRRDLRIPVLPEKLSIRSSTKVDKVSVLSLGEVARIGDLGLRTVKWSSYFPSESEAIDVIKFLQANRNEKKPIRLILTGFDLDINGLFAIDAIDYEERAGEVGDIYYSISLVEWKNYAPRRIEIMRPAGTSKEVAVIKPEPRPGEPEKPKKIVVRAGDSLWALAKKYYGNGGRYPELYEKNREIIDARNRLTGAIRYTIYPGQEFVL